jgi:hypothetical protein
LLTFCLIIFYLPTKGQSDYRLLIDGNKYGLANKDGITLIPAQYENIGWANGTFEPKFELVGYKKNGSWGLISLKNKIVVKAEYSALQPIEGGYFRATKVSANGFSHLSGLLSQQGKVIIGFQYDSISKVGQQYIVSQKALGNDALFGLIDDKEKIILPFTYLSIDKLSDHLILAEYVVGKYYIFNISGQQIINSPIEKVEKHNGLGSYTAFMTQGKWGVLDPNGNIVLKPIYRSVHQNKDGSWTKSTFGSWKVIDTSKKVLATVEADTVAPLSTLNTLVCSNTRYSIYENSTSQFSTPSFESVHLLANKELLVSEQQKFGVLKNNGRTVLELVYDTIITDTEIYYALQNGVWHMFTANGFQIGTNTYDTIIPSIADLIAVNKGGDWGYVDRKGNSTTQLLYGAALPFKFESSIVRFLGYWGALDRTGQWLLHPKYDTVFAVSEKLFIAREKGRTFLMNDQENILFTTYNNLKSTNGTIEEEDTFGNRRVIMPSGHPLTTLDYDSISPLMAGELYIHIRKNRYSLINKNGKVIVAENSKIESIFPFDGEFIGIKKDGRFGFVDKLGNLRIANQYGAIGRWQEGAAAVRLNKKWGFVDRLERILVQPYYDSASDLKQSVSIVSIGDKSGLVNSEGAEVMPVEFNAIDLTNYGNYIVENSTLFGLANPQGRLVLQPQYDSIVEINHDLFLVNFKGKFGLKNLRNVDVMPAIYESLGAMPELGIIYYYKAP